jgi:hypothetical protein
VERFFENLEELKELKDDCQRVIAKIDALLEAEKTYLEERVNYLNASFDVSYKDSLHQRQRDVLESKIGLIDSVGFLLTTVDKEDGDKIIQKCTVMRQKLQQEVDNAYAASAREKALQSVKLKAPSQEEASTGLPKLRAKKRG